ncbi:MAG: 2Fe-2S iron-sulfur cluster-binding protein [Candidatus Latescibacterota bacterium]|jgi:[NiFe] hydrogenase diaphorase moiety small subunit
MSDKITITVDGKEIEGEAGQTILQAAEAAGTYIPHLCAHHDLNPHGSCRVCTVLVNGRPQAACTQPVAPGMVVESDSEKVTEIRRRLIEMLFVEGNHFCMFCEKSGNCELQALAYRFGITAPRYPYLFPDRDLDASHPAVFIDRNRCVLCGRCVRASRELDGKSVFEFVGRGAHKRVAVNAEARLADTDLEAADQALEVCPVGAILRKHVGYKVPIGQRLYDHQPIGSEVETARR